MNVVAQSIVMTSASMMLGAVLVSCGGSGSGTSTPTYSLGTSVSGLNNGATLVLANGNGAQLTVTGNGSFVFSTPLPANASYDVMVVQQPLAQSCTVTGGKGTVQGSNVSVGVSCAPGMVSTLYSFGATGDGQEPFAGLVQGSDGNFYGTTSSSGPYRNGTFFRITSSGQETLLHAFNSATGDIAASASTLTIGPDGRFYGAAPFGGTADMGAVFAADMNGTVQVLYSFSSTNADGQHPRGKVVFDTAGNLYGTTTFGGAYGMGTVYKLTPNGSESILYSFGAASDAAGPSNGLVLGNDGNLYGTSSSGGSTGKGTVFKLTLAGQETVLHSFGSGDGASPESELTLARDGSFYGTTYGGGAYGCGTVFHITPAGNETVLYAFGATSNDACGPMAAVTIGSDGNLYGTAGSGGTGNLGGGAIFTLTTAGKESVLYSFGGLNNNPNGREPAAPLIVGLDGMIYGTAVLGGTYGGGTVFRLN